MDYNPLAGDYARHRGLLPAVLENLIAGSGMTQGFRVLEVGCGTGNYITAIDEMFGCRCWGVDLSEAMLAHAKAQSDRVIFQEGDAARLGLADGEIDFLYSVDAIHHFGDPAEFFREAYRVLKLGGRLCTMTHSEELIRNSPFLSRYFPETVAPNLARYPRIEDLHVWIRAAGFSALSETVVAQAAELADSSLYASKANSSLHLISNDAHRRGLASMERDLNKGPIRGKRRYLAIWATK